MEIINATDGYKLGHHRMYPEGTEQVYSNWTPRSNKYFPEATEGSVVFGIQYLIKEYLIKQFEKNFFNLPKKEAVEMFYRRVNNFVGIESVGYRHIEALYDLGYLPIRIKALPEGSVCPIRVPMMTITNTLPEFFWLTNYLETIISCTLWMPCTSATRARLYKKELHRHACKTGFPTDVNLGFCCHDFSMRGMAGMEAAIISGMAHMTSFVGSETIPAIAALEEYYGANSDEELIAATVPATEHSVMCAGGEEDELGTFKRLINDLYPSGFVSIVSDTWDFWNVIENFLPKLKKDIMARDGRVVIRPDSGDPVDIICGLRTNPHFNTRMKEGKYYCCYAPFNDDAEYVEVSEGQYYGAYYMLGKIFGWNTTSKDYRYPSTKVGLLYGDSITLERQKQIYLRLENAHMAACNLVLGVGSYSYQYASRDSLGFAIKATACVVNGELKEIFKHPKTDDGTKNSLKGLIAVYKGLDGKYTATDQVSIEEEKEGCLETVFEDGILKKEYSLEEIRQRIDHGHPFGKEACKKRLLEEYHKYGKLIVAFDFDNTIFDYHNNGGDYSEVINLLNKCYKLGFHLILFTCETNLQELCIKQMKTAKLLGLDEDFELYTNESPVFPNSEKPYYNILLDDRAGLEESYEILKYVVDEIKLNQQGNQ